MNNNTQKFKKKEILYTDNHCLEQLFNGGIELGSIIQLVSKTMHLKSIITLQMAKLFLEKNHRVLYLNSDKNIKTDNIFYSNFINDRKNTFFYSNESEFDKIEKLIIETIKTKQINFVIIDSLSSLSKPHLANSNFNMNENLINFFTKCKELASLYSVSFIVINKYHNYDKEAGTWINNRGLKYLNYCSKTIIEIHTDNDLCSTSNYINYVDYFNSYKPVSFKTLKSNRVSKGTIVDTSLINYIHNNRKKDCYE